MSKINRLIILDFPIFTVIITICLRFTQQSSNLICNGDFESYDNPIYREYTAFHYYFGYVKPDTNCWYTKPTNSQI